jgi:hypothetical protein
VLLLLHARTHLKKKKIAPVTRMVVVMRRFVTISERILDFIHKEISISLEELLNRWKFLNYLHTQFYIYFHYYLTLTLMHNLFYQEHKHHKMDVNFILITISELCSIFHV